MDIKKLIKQYLSPKEVIFLETDDNLEDIPYVQFCCQQQFIPNFLLLAVRTLEKDKIEMYVDVVYMGDYIEVYIQVK